MEIHSYEYETEKLTEKHYREIDHCSKMKVVILLFFVIGGE